MKTDSPAECMERALDLAALMGQIALSSYRTTLSVETKADGSPVTVADRSGADRSPQHPEALEGEEHLRDSMGQLRRDQSAADAQRGEVRLVPEALDELARASED